MKIIVRSIIPITPLPYLHLGYIAAAPFSVSFPFLALSVILLKIAFDIWKRSRRWAVVIIMLATISFTWFIVRFQYGRFELASSLTKMYANHFLDMATKITAHNGTPVDLEKLYIDTKRELHDGWNRPYRFKTNVKDNITSYSLTSAGRDGIFDTKDDTVYVKSVTLPPPGEKPH